MLSFKTFMKEGFSPASLDKVAFVITKYLKKQTSLVMFRYPGIEQFDGGGSHKGFGIRFLVPKKNQSFRLNWKQPNGVGLANLESFTFWNGKEGRPYVISFKNAVSIIKVLPIIADMLKTNVVPKEIITMPDDVGLNESILSEASYLSEAVTFGMSEIFDGVLDLIQEPNFTKGKIYSRYKGAGFKIFDELERRYPELIAKQGTGYVWLGSPRDLVAIKKQRDSVLGAIGAETATVTRGKDKEDYAAEDSQVDKLEHERERLTYAQQQVDLTNLTKLTAGGSSNSLFVAGRGGVGKTTPVMRTLASMGYVDGKNMFVNKGSISASGLYSLLYRYQNELIVFDDSDSVFGDQEARNVLKGATDTQKFRKLVWSKRGASVMNPDDFSKDEILDAGAVPQYFEFTGKIIFISNLKIDKLDPDGALRTRGYMITIDPTDQELFDFMKIIAPEHDLADGLSLDLKSRMHVVDMISKTKSKDPLSLRMLVRGLNMQAGALAQGVNVSDAEMARMISTYA